jgi:hypothetical protein
VTPDPRLDDATTPHRREDRRFLCGHANTLTSES